MNYYTPVSEILSFSTSIHSWGVSFRRVYVLGGAMRVASLLSVSLPGTLCICFAVAACHYSNDASTEGPQPTTRSTAPLPSPPPPHTTTDSIERPDFVLAIANDLEGYLEDCGCAGSSVGGLARIVAATRHVGANDGAVFLCGCTHPEDEAETFFGELTGLREQIDMPLFWLGQDSTQETRGEPKPEFDELASRLSGFALELRIGSDGDVTLLAPNSAILCSSRSLRPRGRDVCFIAIWRTDRLGPPVFAAGLGPYYAAALGGTASAATAARDYLSQQSEGGPIVARWTSSISRSLAPDEQVEPLVSAINIRLFHSSASVPPPLPEIETLRKTLATQLCGACHEPQVSAWIASKHAGAFGSLVARRQQSDRRCVACHVTVASLEPSGKLLGVFCNSCHQPDTQATSARFEARCEICHTEATDPDGHWQADIRSVCSTGALSSGTCVRQKMPAWQDGSERK